MNFFKGLFSEFKNKFLHIKKVRIVKSNEKAKVTIAQIFNNKVRAAQVFGMLYRIRHEVITISQLEHSRKNS